jgi:23S rRNA (adenine2503-C2)-methyltransferase
MTALPLVFEAPRRGKPPRHLADLTREEARAAVTELGQPAFRADQLARHFYRGVTDPAQMTDLPAAVREELTGALLPGLLTPVRTLSADGGRTRKTLWRLHDGALVESVLMRYPDRATVCISSQAGCGMACPFCATGQNGLTRNLSAAEIVGQAVAAAAAMASGEVPGGPGRLSNVVFMGMGEPLANYVRVRKTLDALVTPAPHGLGLSQRSITVSTVGVVPAIRRLTEEGLHVTLAVSLHAPDDELLGRLLADRRAHVNLIPLNPTPGSRWDASPLPAQREFVARLRAHGVPTTVRDTRGQDIDGACGQLAAADRVEGVPTVAVSAPSLEPPVELGAEADE